MMLFTYINIYKNREKKFHSIFSLNLHKLFFMKNAISFWLNNARPISLPQSLLPALTAVALSYGGGEFNWIAAISSVVGIILVHLGLNLLDDWFDYKVNSAEARAKVATEGFRGRMIKYPYLTSGEATHSQLLKVTSIFLFTALIMGAIVIITRDWKIIWWIIAGLIIGISYSGGPLKLGYSGLGELVIFLMFGPLLMTGVYYAITGILDWKIVSLSIATGLLVTNIVYSHSVLDSAPDKKMGKKTMAHLMGSEKGQIAFSALLNTLPYLIVIAGVVLGKMHPAYLAILLVLPISLWLVGSLNDFVNKRDVPIEPKKWMGPMGDFERFKKAGIDWFMLRWLTARNIVMFFCTLLIVVNLIFG